MSRRMDVRKFPRAPLLLAAALFLVSSCSSLGQTPPPKKPVAPQTVAAPAAPQSTHYPILLLAFGPENSWSLRIGQKGPERLDRAGYPPIPLDPADVSREGTTDAWTYRAKDSATGADVSVHLTRESCNDTTATMKYTFRAEVNHAQIGTLSGCARVAAELFPKINNQTTDDDDEAKNKPAPPTITNFKPPIAIAYVNSAGKVVFGHGATRKIAAPGGSELAVSHDGRKLLYTRSDSTTSPERTIMLYDFVSGKLTELQHGLVRQAFWSPDDSRIAFLKSEGEKWQVWTFPFGAPEKAAALSATSVNSLDGWTNAHTILACDLEKLYWIGEDGQTQQTLPLKEVYGNFEITSSDTIRVHPANQDLLLVSAEYQNPNETSAAPRDPVGLQGRCFLYEVRSKRRIILTPPDQWARAAEWSRDGLQIFYTRAISVVSFVTLRVFWDGTDVRRYVDGRDLVIGQ
jgi:uncharacterized membrane protein